LNKLVPHYLLVVIFFQEVVAFSLSQLENLTLVAGVLETVEE
jgi:hypothetical protein